MTGQACVLHPGRGTHPRAYDLRADVRGRAPETHVSTLASPWTAELEHRGDPDGPGRAEIRDLVTTLTREIASRPDDDRLLRSLVLDFPDRFRASSALLAATRADGALVPVSRFGRLPAGTDVPVLAAEGDGPVARASRQAEPYVLGTAAEAVAAHPADGAAATPLAAVQLVTNGATAGVILVCFEADVPDTEALADLMVVLRGLVSLHVRDAWRAPLVVPSAWPLHVVDAADDALTARRIEILRLMSIGLSNKAIAQRIGYSESTVRHESMAIYRILDVADRRTACLVARTRGLLD
jgi:DNA-binding CsgD family transcriptional regulator